MWYERCRIAPAAVLLAAVYLLVLPPLLLPAIFSAALLHELGHYAALRLMKGSVKAVNITVFGVEMTVEGQRTYLQEMLLAAAGPAVNLLLALLLSRLGPYMANMYLFAGVHLVLGLFNLFPVLPLDGGMVLLHAASWATDPYIGERISAVTGTAAAVLLTVVAVWMLLRGGSPFMLLASFGLLGTPMRQIGLVKPRQTG